MDHLEMVEKLREKANVSYEEASAALEKSNWDLLDALLLLESEGRLHSHAESAYSTRKADENPADTTAHRRSPGVIGQLMHGFAGVIRKCNSISVQIKKRGEVRLALPLTVVILLCIFVFWAMLIAAALGMLFGYRYTISGLSIDETVNSAMEKAGDFVDTVVKPADVHVVVEEDKTEE